MLPSQLGGDDSDEQTAPVRVPPPQPAARSPSPPITPQPFAPSTPAKAASGREVLCVIDYLKENLDDADSLQFVRWSGVKQMPYARPWSVSDAPKVNASLVRVKFRAKNKLGALVINEWVFAFKNGSVIDAFSLEDRDEIGLGTYRRFYPPGFFPGE